MQTQPTYKVCRRLGAGVFDKCQTQKFMLSEAKRGKSIKGRRKTASDFSRQLLEKQRVRFAYGLRERQLRAYVAEAQRVLRLGGDPVARMLEQLELRLDNIVYRSGLVASRRAARQLVAHGHVLVNGVRSTVPSMRLAEGDTFSLRDRTRGRPIMPILKEHAEAATVPAWISYDAAKSVGKVAARPSPDNTETPGSVGTILEYYSR